MVCDMSEVSKKQGGSNYVRGKGFLTMKSTGLGHG